MLFVGRSEEQDRFRHVLTEVAGDADSGPDEGYVVLVQGYGGIGKSTLLSRFGEIATGQEKSRSRFTVAVVDWEHDRRRHPEHYALFAGPPIWRILEQVRGAVEQSAAKESRRVRRRVESGFAAFLRQVTHIRELEQRAVELGIGHVLGRQRLTAEQIGKVTKPVTDFAALAGVPTAVTTTVSRAVDASVGMVSALRGDKERMDLAAYRALVDEIDGVVAAFSDGMRALARTQPVVVLLDTCELLGESGDWLREVMRRCGRGVLWVLGMRLEPDLQAAGDSDAVQYRRTLNERRLRVITLSRFDDRTVADYIAHSLGSLMPVDLDVDRIVALTHAVPLAMRLLCDMLIDQIRAGRRIDDLYEEISPEGEISTVVADMARRYLVHANREDSELHADLPFLYGLALLRSEKDSYGADPRFLFDWLNDIPSEPEPVPTARDPELLATLWNTPVETVAAVMARLAHRHDFVHSRNGSLHRDVRDAIRLHLLIPVNRVVVTAMNRRAADHFTARIAATNHTTIDDQLEDPTWRADVAGLLWHTCWINPPDGIALLRHLYPAAAVLQPAYASLLHDITTLFASHCPKLDQRLLKGLTVLSSFWWDEEEPAARAAVDVLASAPSPARPLLAGPSEPYLHLLRADSSGTLGLRLSEQVAQLRSAADSVRPGSGPTATRLGEIALELFLTDPAAHPQLGKALVAGYKLATRYLPTNPRAYVNLGYALGEVGRYAEAEKAEREAIRLDPDDANAHVNLGYTLGKLNRFEEAEAAYRKAISIDPDQVLAYANLGYLLGELGRFEEAEASCREAIRINPDLANVHVSLGYILGSLGRLEEAEAAEREAIRIDPHHVNAHMNLGLTLSTPGRFEEAEASCREAIRINPDLADAYVSLGYILGNLGRLKEAEAACREAIRIDPTQADAHENLGELRLFAGDRDQARPLLLEASRLSGGALLSTEVLLWAMNRASGDDELKAHTPQAVLASVEKPAPPGFERSPFSLAEARALALAGCGQGKEAVETLRSAVATRRADDQFVRPLYDLLSTPKPIAGLDELIQVWTEIIADDPTALSRWGVSDADATAT